MLTYSQLVVEVNDRFNLQFNLTEGEVEVVLRYIDQSETVSFVDAAYLVVDTITKRVELHRGPSVGLAKDPGLKRQR